MKIVNKIKLIYRVCSKRIFVTVMLFAICGMSFYISDHVFYSYIKDVLKIRHEESMYGIKPENINKITFAVDSSYEDRIKVIDILNATDEIECCGSMCVSKAFEILEGRESISFIVADARLAEIGNTGLCISEVEDMYARYPGYEPVMLGYSYRSLVEVGETLTIPSMYGGEATCIVAGFLKKDAQWINNPDNAVEYYNLNDYGILLTKTFDRFCFDKVVDFCSPVYYVCDRKNRESVSDYIMEVMAEQDIRAGITNEGDILSETLEDLDISADKSFLSAVVMYIISIISISAVSIVECMINRRDYAVYIISGISRRGVYSMMLIKNIFITLLPAVGAWVICQFEMFGKVVPVAYTETGAYDYIPSLMSHCVYVPLVLLTQIVIMVAVSCIVPVIYVSRSKLTDMLKN